MKKSISLSTIISIGFALASTLFLAISYREGSRKYKIFKEGIETEGLVINTYRKPTRTGESRSLAEAPVVQFLTNANKSQLYYSTVFTSPAYYQPGQRVKIWYLPESPSTATLDGKDAWILSLAFGIFGAAISLIAYASLISIVLKRLRNRSNNR